MRERSNSLLYEEEKETIESAALYDPTKTRKFIQQVRYRLRSIKKNFLRITINNKSRFSRFSATKNKNRKKISLKLY